MRNYDIYKCAAQINDRKSRRKFLKDVECAERLLTASCESIRILRDPHMNTLLAPDRLHHDVQIAFGWYWDALRLRRNAFARHQRLTGVRWYDRPRQTAP